MSEFKLQSGFTIDVDHLQARSPGVVDIYTGWDDRNRFYTETNYPKQKITNEDFINIIDTLIAELQEDRARFLGE